MRQITVIGCGYLGAVHAAAMADLGHQVLGVETSPTRVEALAKGLPPFYEPGLSELLRRGTDAGRLRFTQAATPAELAQAQVHFLGVGTPQEAGGNGADLSYLWSALETLAQALPARRLEDQPLVVGKSTVPVGTARQVAQVLEGKALVLWNPEFLREGHAIKDTLHPDRVVYGLPDEPVAAERACGLLDEVYALLLLEGVPRLTMSLETAELVKTAANSFLAMKISFINAMSTMCSATGADVTALAQAIGHDKRIGRHFLRSGIGFGGGCLPKDLRALEARAKELQVDELATLLAQVDLINLGQRDRVEQMALDALGGQARGKRVTVLGATFKPDSDDLRDSPAVDVAVRLADAGAKVTVCDPKGLPALAQAHPVLHTQPDLYTALSGADLVVLATEWKELTQVDPVLARAVVSRAVVIDARNTLDPQQWRAAHWDYRALGRGPGTGMSAQERSSDTCTISGWTSA